MSGNEEAAETASFLEDINVKESAQAVEAILSWGSQTPPQASCWEWHDGVSGHSESRGTEAS